MAPAELTPLRDSKALLLSLSLCLFSPRATDVVAAFSSPLYLSERLQHVQPQIDDRDAASAGSAPAKINSAERERRETWVYSLD